MLLCVENRYSLSCSKLELLRSRVATTMCSIELETVVVAFEMPPLAVCTELLTDDYTTTVTEQ